MVQSNQPEPQKRQGHTGSVEWSYERIQNDEAYRNEFYRAVRPRLLRLLERRLRNPSDAEDVVHEAFVGFFLGHAPANMQCPVKKLYWIARKRVVDQHRKNCRRDGAPKKQLVLPSSMDDIDDAKHRERHDAEARERHSRKLARSYCDREVDDPSTLLEQDDSHRRVQERLNQLSEREQKVIHLRYHEGLRPTEIAELLDVPLGTIKSDHHRAIKKLRECGPNDL
ncbi:MAG: RNA polymerase sigma factor FliA [Phycisphaerae bacterium]|nr:RNA polymerase sigma factor FliA [Phycisphaerae bacterium]